MAIKVRDATFARRLGDRLASRYADWDRPDAGDLQAQAALLMALPSEAGQSCPLTRSCSAVARRVGDWKGHPYHSATHHAEVSTNAMVLASLCQEPLAERDRLVLLCAALGHDLLYDPGLAHQPYRQEAVAAEAVVSIMKTCGAGAAERELVAALILATELMARPSLREAVEGNVNALPDCLGILAGSGKVWLAAILSDADLLGSAGLTEDWTRVLTARLSEETGRMLGPDEVCRFFDLGVGGHFVSAPGRIFDPNLRHIRAGLMTPGPCPG